MSDGTKRVFWLKETEIYSRAEEADEYMSKEITTSSNMTIHDHSPAYSFHSTIRRSFHLDDGVLEDCPRERLHQRRIEATVCTAC